jgi:hypothetical protein
LAPGSRRKALVRLESPAKAGASKKGHIVSKFTAKIFLELKGGSSEKANQK